MSFSDVVYYQLWEFLFFRLLTLNMTASFQNSPSLHHQFHLHVRKKASEILHSPIQGNSKHLWRRTYELRTDAITKRVSVYGTAVHHTGSTTRERTVKHSFYSKTERTILTKFTEIKEKCIILNFYNRLLSISALFQDFMTETLINLSICCTHSFVFIFLSNNSIIFFLQSFHTWLRRHASFLLQYEAYSKGHETRVGWRRGHISFNQRAVQFLWHQASAIFAVWAVASSCWSDKALFNIQAFTHGTTFPSTC